MITQKLRRVLAVPRLCGFYPGICLITEEKARKKLSQGSQNNTVSEKKIFKENPVRMPIYLKSYTGWAGITCGRTR